MTARDAEDVLNAWRSAMADPCTCRPDDGSGTCPREQECYEAWCRWFDLNPRHSDGEVERG